MLEDWGFKSFLSFIELGSVNIWVEKDICSGNSKVLYTIVKNNWLVIFTIDAEFLSNHKGKGKGNNKM